jgi:hypothetical protein
VIHLVRVTPPPGTRCGDYALDAFTVEQVDDGAVDFRFELGSGYVIYWALPAAAGERLRLFEVDSAVYTVDEPVLHADPFVFDLPRLAWTGELGTLASGVMVTAIAIEVTAAPASYRCEITLRASPSSQERAMHLVWP